MKYMHSEVYDFMVNISIVHVVNYIVNMLIVKEKCECGIYKVDPHSEPCVVSWMSWLDLCSSL